MTLNDKVRRFFDRNEITYQFLPSEDENELDSFEAGFKGHNGNFKLRVLTNEEDEWMLIIGFPAFSVPQKYMEQGIHAANLLNRNRLFVLCYVDPDDGEVAYRLGLMVPPGTPDETIERAIWTVCAATDNDNASFMEAVFRDNGAMN